MNPQSAQDLVNAGFYGYQGWNDASALADFRATGGSGKGSSTNIAGGVANQAGGFTGSLPSLNIGGLDIVSAARQLAQPGIQATQQAISDIKGRYSQLLGEIKGRAETDVASEFGKRGIPTSSGVVQQAQGREAASRQAQGLLSETQALAPFYQMLIGAQSLDPSLIGAYLSSQQAGAAGARPGLEDLWSSSFATGGQSQTQLSPAQQQSQQAQQAFKQRVTSGAVSTAPLTGQSAFTQRVLSGNVPQATVTTQQSPISSAVSQFGNLLGGLFNKTPTSFLRA